MLRRRNASCATSTLGKKEAKCGFANGGAGRTVISSARRFSAKSIPPAALAQEEIFGPVLSDDPGARFRRTLCRSPTLRLCAYRRDLSRSPAHIELARKDFRVGNLYINRGITGAVVERQPFGGLKLSGIGSKAGGPDYLLQFLEPRTISENTLRHGFVPPEK